MKKFPFSRYRYYAYAFSIGSLVAFAAITFARGGFAFGIDFAGGTTIQVRFRDVVTQDLVGKIRTALLPRGLGENLRATSDALGNPSHEIEVSVRGEKFVKEQVSRFMAERQAKGEAFTAEDIVRLFPDLPPNLLLAKFGSEGEGHLDPRTAAENEIQEAFQGIFNSSIGDVVADLLAPLFPSAASANPLFDVNTSFSPEAIAADLARARVAFHVERLATSAETAWATPADLARAAGVPDDLARVLAANLASETAAATLPGRRPTLASPPADILSLIVPALSDRYLPVAAEIFAAREAKGGLFASPDEAAGVARAKGNEEAALLYARAGASPFVIAGTETVGPVVGEALKRQAAWAVFLSLFFGILCYVWARFELRYSVGAILATAHDALFVTLLLGAIQHEITISVIASILTVIGYSVNDTIVVYDRIRERMGTLTKTAREDVIDLAVTETLSRTIITGMTTLFAVLAFYFFGPVVLNDFSLVLLVGILIGTFSSIFVAAPVLIEWDRFVVARAAAGAAAPYPGHAGKTKK